MGLKKRGLKAGCWNGFGGKLEQDETPLECIVRETEEEAGIKLDEAREIGICKFHNYGFKYTIQVHFFRSKSYSGKLISTDEMEPKWFDLDKIPYDNMWPSDFHILPMVIENTEFFGEFWFKKDGSIRKFELRKLE